MSDPAYVKIFDRLRRVGLDCDADLRYRVAMRLAKLHRDSDDPALERLGDLQFRARAIPTIYTIIGESVSNSY